VQKGSDRENPVRAHGSEFLLTGATGFLGKVVLHELLRRRQELGVNRVHVLLRTNGSGTAKERFDTDIAASACFANLAPDWRMQVSAVAGDLSLPGAGLAPGAGAALAGRVTHVINCAASVQFDLPVQEAATANVATALEILNLARRCQRLKSLVSVSTAYVTPHDGAAGKISETLAPLPRRATDLYDAILRGEVDEQQLLAETGHPNTYTLTKCIAEHLLSERCGGVPLRLVRPSIISASMRWPSPGWIDSPAAFALFAAQIGAGHMHAIIGRPDARIDVIPCDAVADRVIAVACRPGPIDGPAETSILHAVAGYERSMTVRLCISTIEAFFAQNPDTRWRNRDLTARVHYLGPDGLLYRINHWLYHQRRLKSRRKADHLSQANRMFAYFTHNTFRFVSTAPFDSPDFEPITYIKAACRGVAQHLMGADNTAVPIAGRLHPRSRGDLRWALQQKNGNVFIRVAACLVIKALRRCTDCVTVDLTSFEAAVRAAAPGSSFVLVPSHRSYLDFVLCSQLMFSRPDIGIDIPYIAATSDFARIPVLSWLFLHLHAFYLQRGLGREDKKLTLQVHSLIRSGRVLEFFIEGRRSRSRQFLPPRRGLLRSLQATGDVCTVLPIAFSYDHVPEETAFIEELGGAPRPPMQLRGLMRWIRRLLRDEVSLGRAHIACGQPVVLKPQSDVFVVSRDIMAELQRKTVTTTHHLSTFLARERATLGDIDLEWLSQAITQRGGSVLTTKKRDHAVSPRVERCMRYQFEHLFYAEAEVAFAGHPTVDNHIRLNRFAEPGPPLTPVDPQDPRLQQLLRTLFGPVVQNYLAAATALGEPGPTLHLNSPIAVLQSEAGRNLHLPDVEATFTDLAERRILRRKDEKSFAWGPEAAQIAAYIACLVPI